MNSAVLPFLTIPGELIECSPWRIELSTGAAQEDPEFLENWDNATNLRLSREVRLDIEAASGALRIPPDQITLELVVTAGTGTGRLPVEKWIALRRPVEGDATQMLIEFTVQGERLADALHLDMAVVLAEAPGNATSAISPKHQGAMLWRERKRIRLEGDISRFPVSETDLGILLGETWRDALWHLQVDWSDHGADFDTAVRLHVNSRHNGFTRKFRQGDPETLQCVMADVMAQITRGWLQCGEELEGVSIEETSSTLSGVAAHWVDLAFGSPDEARRMLIADPGRFQTHLNALAAQPEEG